MIHAHSVFRAAWRCPGQRLSHIHASTRSSCGRPHLFLRWLPPAPLPAQAQSPPAPARPGGPAGGQEQGSGECQAAYGFYQGRHTKTCRRAAGLGSRKATSPPTPTRRPGAILCLPARCRLPPRHSRVGPSWTPPHRCSAAGHCSSCHHCCWPLLRQEAARPATGRQKHPT